jgi:ABC-type transport system substrate-binding protein
VGVLQIESGQADAMLDVVPTGEYARISQDPGLADNMMLSRAFANLIYVAPDTRSEPFNNLDVRRALNMAVDRDHLVDILNGRATPGAGPIPPGVQGDNVDLQPQALDIEGAQALLADAGFADGITTQLYTYTDPTLTAVGQALVQDWAQIGVTVELVTLDFSALLDIMYNNPEEMPLLLIDWYMDYPDPSNTYQPLIKCGAANNPGAYCNEDLDAMETAAAAEPPGDARWSAYSELEAAVADQLPILTLYHVNQYYYFSDRVQGMNSHPAYIIKFDSLSLEG